MSLTTKNTDGSKSGPFLSVFLLTLGLAGLASGGALAQNAAGDGEGCDGTDDVVFACGAGSLAAGPGSSSFGHGAGSANGGTALGQDSSAGTSAVAVGYSAAAIGPRSIAIGGQNGPGGETQAPGADTIAIGAGANANNARSLAMGTDTTASQDGIALGYSATANTNAIAIGSEVSTDRDGQVKIGGVANTYTLTGVASQTGRDVQGTDEDAVYLLTTDEAGNLAASTFDFATLEDLPATVEQHTTEITNLNTTVTENSVDIADHETRITNNTGTLNLHTTQIAGLDSRVTVNENNIELLDGRVTSLETGFDSLGAEIAANRDEARGGTALALAAASLRYDDRPEKVSIAGGVGHFKGLTGLSFGVGYATSDTFRINGAVSGVPERGDVGFSAGVSWTLN